MKEHKWAEVLRGIADGKDVEFHDVLQWENPKNINPLSNPEYLWRIKSTKTPVDLSILIKSGIDCEFWDREQRTKYISKLKTINLECVEAYFDNEDGWKYCRPRHDHWHTWLGGVCPLPEGFIVYVLRRDGSHDTLTYLEPEEWVHKEWLYDIIAFKVVGLDTENYYYPWESEE